MLSCTLFVRHLSRASMSAGQDSWLHPLHGPQLLPFLIRASLRLSFPIYK